MPPGAVPPAVNQYNNQQMPPRPIQTPMQQANYYGQQWNYNSPYPNAPFPVKKKKNGGLIALLVILLLALLGGGGWAAYNYLIKPKIENKWEATSSSDNKDVESFSTDADNDDSTSTENNDNESNDAENEFNSELQENSEDDIPQGLDNTKGQNEPFGMTDEEAAALKNSKNITNKQPDLNAMSKAFAKKIREYRGRSGYGYFLYDLTGDGFPELWAHTGTCEADYKIDIYTYSNGKMKFLYQTPAGHTTFHAGRKGYVIGQFGHMGYETLYRITYSGGKVRERKYLERDLNKNPNLDYTNLREPELSYTPFNDTNPLEYYF